MKKILALIGGLTYDSQKKIVKGIWERAKKEGADVFVFTCHVNASDGERGQEGAHRIYTLPDLSEYDGVIFVYHTIYYEAPGLTNQIASDICAKGIRAVCIDKELDGMANLMLDNYTGIYQLVEHLIVEHGKKEIYFLGGLGDSEDFRQRKQAYLDVMEKHNLEIKPGQIQEASFSANSGKKAWEYWTKECGQMPEAVVCVSDVMAAGMRLAIQCENRKIPEDVIVTGMDNNWEASYGNPRLTTIERAYYDAGEKACELILGEKTAEELAQVKESLPSTVIFSESCGCKGELPLDIQMVCEELVDEKLYHQVLADNLKGMFHDSTSANTLDEFAEAMKKYVGISESQYFYLCLNPFQTVYEEDSIDEKKKEEFYADTLVVPLSYENGRFGSYDVCYKKEIIPRGCVRDAEPVLYICLPLSYQKQSFGYCVFGNSKFPLEQYMCYTWVLTISGAIQNIKRKMQLNATIEKLNKMWIYDSMTGLYNRAGFFSVSRPMLTQFKKEKRSIFVVFMDLDGLKKVNDEYGHDVGDDYICAMAEILKEVTEKHEIAMRYGGDEFVILGPVREYDRAEEIMDKINEMVADMNQQRELKYKLSVSMGSQVIPPKKDDCGLGSILEKADREMYKKKREKYRKLKENGIINENVYY